MIAYHDTEWGEPVYDEQRLFEFLSLEGMQAGLSWSCILKKREAYRKAFYQFNLEKVAKMNDDDVEKLMLNEGIVRNRLKIKSIIKNAQNWLKIAQNESVVEKLWSFVGGEPIYNRYQSDTDVSATNKDAILLSQWLKSEGFSFVGPVICYAFMQATGMVDDHVKNCFKYKK